MPTVPIGRIAVVSREYVAAHASCASSSYSILRAGQKYPEIELLEPGEYIIRVSRVDILSAGESCVVKTGDDSRPNGIVSYKVTFDGTNVTEERITQAGFFGRLWQRFTSHRRKERPRLY